MSYQQPQQPYQQPYQPPTAYDPYGEPYNAQLPRTSGLGITSLCLAIAGMIIIFVMFLFTGYLGMRARFAERPDPTTMAMVGFGIILGVGIAIVASILGFIALVNPNQTKGFAAVGMTLGLMTSLGVITVFIISITIRGA